MTALTILLISLFVLSTRGSRLAAQKCGGDRRTMAARANSSRSNS
jgi:hypothetical protein